MTDIVGQPDRLLSSVVSVMVEAVDEIERLRAEAARLRASLGEMVTTFYDAGCHICGGDCALANPPVVRCPIGVIQRARTALREGRHD